LHLIAHKIVETGKSSESQKEVDDFHAGGRGFVGPDQLTGG